MKFQQISAGGQHTCALALDSRIFCWGDNLRGQLGDPNVRQSALPVEALSTAAFTAVGSGGAHTCGLRGDGALFCWGSNEVGQLAMGGGGVGVPTQINSALRFASFATGDRRTCGRTADGAGYCWGATWVERRNGIEITRTQVAPLRFAPTISFQAVSVGVGTTCAISIDFASYCWEANPTGGIGDGTTSGSLTPIAVSSQRRFVAISPGRRHTCAIADVGQAYCWGAGELGASPAILGSRCGEVSSVPCNVIPIRVSGWRIFSGISSGLGDHTCALTLSGNVYCWGAGALGQRGDGRTSAEWSPAKTKSP
jgi:alpha-tubulin suppressor-like RCC1 family protein